MVTVFFFCYSNFKWLTNLYKPEHLPSELVRSVCVRVCEPYMFAPLDAFLRRRPWNLKPLTHGLKKKFCIYFFCGVCCWRNYVSFGGEISYNDTSSVTSFFKVFHVLTAGNEEVVKDPHHDGGTSCADGSEVHCCARTCCIISVEILRGRSIRTNCGFTNNTIASI